MKSKKPITVYAKITVEMSRELDRRCEERDVSRAHELKRALREMLERERAMAPARP